MGKLEKRFLICKKINYDKENQETKNRVDAAVSKIKTSMRAMGYKEVSHPDGHQNIDYIFSVGGDGTMMHSLHNYMHNDSEIIGINAGNLGFLTPFSLEEVHDLSLFDMLANKEYRKEKRSFLLNEIFSSETGNGVFGGFAVNEYAITASGPNDVLDFSIVIEKNGIISDAGYYKANAVLIVGPCGSTAYSMNAGGAIIDPSMRCMQINMVAPQTLGIRPIIVGPKSKIKIKFGEGARVFSDGIEEFNSTEKVIFEASLIPDDVSIVLPKDWNFFDTLAKKLHWNNGKLN